MYLSVSEKVYRRLITEKMMASIESQMKGQQVDCTRGKGCFDQVFSLRILIEKYVEKHEIPSLRFRRRCMMGRSV